MVTNMLPRKSRALRLFSSSIDTPCQLHRNMVYCFETTFLYWPNHNRLITILWSWQETLAYMHIAPGTGGHIKPPKDEAHKKKHIGIRKNTRPSQAFIVVILKRCIVYVHQPYRTLLLVMFVIFYLWVLHIFHTSIQWSNIVVHLFHYQQIHQLCHFLSLTHEEKQKHLLIYSLSSASERSYPVEVWNCAQIKIDPSVWNVSLFPQSVKKAALALAGFVTVWFLDIWGLFM